MKNKFFFFLIFILFAADRLFKELSLKKFSVGQTEDFFIIPNFFSFTFFKNEHLAFSLPLTVKITVIISILVITALFILLFREFGKRRIRSALFLSLFIIGALSNLQDRVALGFVIDYFHLYPISYFNLADVMIGVGIITVLNSQIRSRKQ